MKRLVVDLLRENRSNKNHSLLHYLKCRYRSQKSICTLTVRDLFARASSRTVRGNADHIFFPTYFCRKLVTDIETRGGERGWPGFEDYRRIVRCRYELRVRTLRRSHQTFSRKRVKVDAETLHWQSPCRASSQVHRGTSCNDHFNYIHIMHAIRLSVGRR